MLYFVVVIFIVNKMRGLFWGVGLYFDKFYVSFSFYYLFIVRGYLLKYIILLLCMK